jgi:hypothetical protein
MLGEVSDQLWCDILGVLLIQQDRLDKPYMQKMADHLGILDLLESAFQQVFSKLNKFSVQPICQSETMMLVSGEEKRGEHFLFIRHFCKNNHCCSIQFIL